MGEEISSTVKEEFSYSYLHCIVAGIGAEMNKTGRLLDNDGIDVTIRMPHGIINGSKNPKPGMDVQMKSTSSPSYDKDLKHLHMDISVKLFNEMRNSISIDPTILMVLVIPEEVEDWVLVSGD